ncbi:MAG: hypothetical protein ABI448_10310 [Bacteroidia bacterium]
MKKSVLALAMAFGVTSAFAQDLTSKKGEPILPEKGDWAISADATPFLNYMGNFFGKTGPNGSPTFDFLASHSVIVGKYFLDEKTAIRAGINLAFQSHSTTNLVAQDQPGTIPAGTLAPTVIDKATRSNTGIGITAGIEKRKGKTRLQGYYGAELGFFIGGTTDKFTYGNAFAAAGSTAGTSANPYSTNWTGIPNTATSYNLNGNTPASVATGSGRVTQSKLGTNVEIGVRGFIGVEYFILPKMSLGGEFGWGIGGVIGGATSQTKEGIYAGTAVTTQEVKGGKTNAFIIGTDNKNSFFGPTGSLRLNFYF